MAQHEELLRRYQPQLRYDSQEAFFADSAATFTDNPGHMLRRAHREDGEPPEVIAVAGTGEQDLSLVFLGHPRYANGAEYRPGDHISDPRRDYRDQARALHQNPDYANVMYGRAKEDGEGRLWLQYWLFYFYNDYNLAGGIGLHEGDWEMVQLRMDGDEPDLAVYAQHAHAESRRWEEVEKVDGVRPVVYVARGSHASYFTRGLHFTEVWFDVADGRRVTPRLRLELLGEDSPGWALWRGRWGDTQKRVQKIDTPSPEGVAAHDQWDDPAALLRDAKGHETQAPPKPPRVRVSRRAGHLVIDYDFSRLGPGEVQPERLVVTTNSADDRLPPATDTFVLDAAIRGRIETRRALDDDKRYDVHVSAVTAEGRPTESVRTDLAPAARGIGRIPGALEGVPLVGGLLRRLRPRLGGGARAGP